MQQTSIRNDKHMPALQERSRLSHIAEDPTRKVSISGKPELSSHTMSLLVQAYAGLQERSRLSHMAEDHARKLGEPSEAARLPALFAAGRLDGTPAAQLAALQVQEPSKGSIRWFRNRSPALQLPTNRDSLSVICLKKTRLYALQIKGHHSLVRSARR